MSCTFERGSLLVVRDAVKGRIEFAFRDGVNPSVEPSGKSSLI
jgi:hypothetical protein